MPISYSCPKCGFISADTSAAHTCAVGGVDLKSFVVDGPRVVRVTDLAAEVARLTAKLERARALLARALEHVDAEALCGPAGPQREAETLYHEIKAYLGVARDTVFTFCRTCEATTPAWEHAPTCPYQTGDPYDGTDGREGKE